MNGQVKIDIDSLVQLHRFGDIFERAINEIASATVSLEPRRDAVDSIGRHWYGMRLGVASKKAGGQKFYLHTGLIFMPETRVGLMVEVDRKNNLDVYDTLWECLQAQEEFDVNRDEEEYLKLFMPDVAFNSLFRLDASAQVCLLGRFIQACTEAIAKTAESHGFRIRYDDLADAYKLALLFEKVLQTYGSSSYGAEINYADKDNFGQYASGYRYYLTSPDKAVSMYAYFGVIYSYKKRPRGVFMEIDRYSNPDWFDKVMKTFADDPAYDTSRAEDGFLKLFLPEETTRRFNEACESEQQAILADFLDACNSHVMEAAITHK